MKTTLTAAAALMIAISPLAAQTTEPAATAPVTFIEQQTNDEVLGTDFVGTPVLAKDNQQIGKIANLVFDKDGRIAIAVIGVGGVLGIGEKEVAVPFDAIKSESKDNKHVFTVDATKEQLKAAPAYKTLNDQAFNQRVAEWRQKAAESWKQAKEKAGQAYEQAKDKVNEKINENKPAETPKSQ